MKLAVKLSSLLILGMVALLAVNAYFAVHRETALFRSDMEHDAKLLGQTMRTLITDVWDANGQQRALQLIQDANRQDKIMNLRWVWLDGTGNADARPQIQGAKLDLVASGTTVSVQMPEGSFNGRLITYVPVAVDGKYRGAIELSESMLQLRTFRLRIIRRSLGLMGALLAVGGLTITVLGTLIVGRPLSFLAERVHGIGHGNLDTKLNLRTNDELSELAGALNHMCCDLAAAREIARTETDARIAALEQLRHAERLATVGRLASGIAHEVGTPLNVISARAKQIRNASAPGSSIRDHAMIVGRQSDRIARIVRQLLAFARPGREPREPHDLAKLAERVIALLEPLATKQDVTLSPLVCIGSPPTVHVNPSQLEHVLANLVDNAIQAMPDGGTIETRVGTRRAKSPWNNDAEATWAFVEIADHGTGIPKETLPKVFDPFFTTKEVGEGTGLGLSLAFGIVREHRGWIDAASELKKGSCFTVFLPTADVGVSEPDVGSAVPESSGPTSSNSSVGMR